MFCEVLRLLKTELFLGNWGAKANTFREARKLFAGRRGGKCIIFREHRTPWGSQGGFLKVVVGYMFVSKKCGRFSKGCRKVVS